MNATLRLRRKAARYEFANLCQSLFKKAAVIYAVLVITLCLGVAAWRQFGTVTVNPKIDQQLIGFLAGLIGYGLIAAAFVWLIDYTHHILVEIVIIAISCLFAYLLLSNLVLPFIESGGLEVELQAFVQSIT